MTRQTGHILCGGNYSNLTFAQDQLHLHIFDPKFDRRYISALESMGAEIDIYTRISQEAIDDIACENGSIILIDPDEYGSHSIDAKIFQTESGLSSKKFIKAMLTSTPVIVYTKKGIECNNTYPKDMIYSGMQKLTTVTKDRLVAINKTSTFQELVTCISRTLARYGWKPQNNQEITGFVEPVEIGLGYWEGRSAGAHAGNLHGSSQADYKFYGTMLEIVRIIDKIDPHNSTEESRKYVKKQLQDRYKSPLAEFNKNIPDYSLPEKQEAYSKAYDEAYEIHFRQKFIQRTRECRDNISDFEYHTIQRLWSDASLYCFHRMDKAIEESPITCKTIRSYIHQSI